MTQGRTARELLPDAVRHVLDEFRRSFSLDLHLWAAAPGEAPLHLYPPGSEGGGPDPASVLRAVPTRDGGELTVEIRGTADPTVTAAASVLRTSLEHLYEYSEEVRFFTYEVSERYEEINLLYSISETLGSLIQLREAAHLILTEVCDVMGARRGSLWVGDRDDERLHVIASVGEEGREGPLDTEDPSAVTSQVFREGRPVILSGEGLERERGGVVLAGEDSALSVPIRYTPPGGDARTVGVLNLIGRRRGGRFTASDQKLLTAIASQVGAALENNRLLHDSLERERVSREMELAHDLQMKLLPTEEGVHRDQVGARVEPAESVGGDFYHFFRMPGHRIGVMIGDVSSHGFPAALIMALSMSAATIYASEFESPAGVLQGMAGALMDELETTEMYLTLFYGVVDPAKGELVYANAGHPHAFVIREEGTAERLPAIDPPMGIAGSGEYGEESVEWRSGRDLLLLFTDGLSDDLVAGSRMAGEGRVVEEAVRLRSCPVAEVVEALFRIEREKAEDGASGDDRTAVVLRA